MLQNIGDLLKGKKFLAWLILIPLVVVFAIWGATGAINFDLSGSRTVAASGAGIEVNFDRTNRIWQDELSLYQQQTGSEAPQEIRDLLLEQTLETLIVGELIAARAGGMGYAVSERAVFEAIQSEPAFLVEGRYSEGLALARLSQLGISADQYRRDIRRDLQNLELQRSLFLGEFVTPGEIGRVLTLEG
jgi:parvulin-like peptidyl-prolyl isomerase